jgi:hypothetical protein
MNTLIVVHVAISLIAIFTGFVAVFEMIGSKPRSAWTSVFLWTTLATSVTGFFFPFRGFTPALAFGVLTLFLLSATFFALYARKLAGAWRWIYVVTAVVSFYLNFFVLIVQSFLKIPALHALAPTQKEPPFAAAQGAALLLFLVLGFLAVKQYRPAAVAA